MWCGLFGSRIKLSGLDGIVHGGSGSSGGVARLSSDDRCLAAISSISVGSVVILPVEGFLTDVSLGVFLALGCRPAETLRPWW